MTQQDADPTSTEPAIPAAPTDQPAMDIDRLVDFFVSRCDRDLELSEIGETLFQALQLSQPCTTEAGRRRESFSFERVGDTVRTFVDRRLLAILQHDDAIRLATLLHGAPKTHLAERRAA